MARRDELRELRNLISRLNDTYKKIPGEAATIAVNFTKERFRMQNWVDRRREKWQPRKDNRGRAGRRAILTKSARLRRSISKIEVTDHSATIGTDVPYAKIHNEGGRINKTVTVKEYQRKAHSRKRGGRRERVKAHTVHSHARNIDMIMPRRQFIGESRLLDRRIERMMTGKINHVLRQLNNR